MTKEYNVSAEYSNRAGAAMHAGPFRSRSQAEAAAVQMVAKGYETVRISTVEINEEDGQ